MTGAKLLESVKNILDDFLVFMGQMVCFIIFIVIIIGITCVIKKDTGWMIDPEQILPFFYFFVIGGFLIMNIDNFKIIIKKIKERNMKK